MKASSRIASSALIGTITFGGCSSSDYVKQPDKESKAGNPENRDTANYMEEIVDHREYFDNIINTVERAGRIDLAVSFAMYSGGMNRVARIFEERGDYESARYWAKLGRDRDYFFRLHEKQLDYLIKREILSALSVVRKLGNSDREIGLKKKVLAALERNEKFAYAGDFALELGYHERAFLNYGMWEEADPEKIQDLANIIAAKAEKKGDLKTAAEYLEKAGNWGDRSGFVSAAKLFEGQDDFEGARRTLIKSGEFEWAKTELAKHAKSRINQLAEQGELYQALSISRDIGDKEKEALIKSCIQLEKAISLKNWLK